MCMYVIFCLCLCICLLALPLSLLLSFWDKHKQSISLPCPCLCICLYYFAYICLSFGDKHNCVNRSFYFFCLFLLCLSFLDEHNCVNLPANDFPPRGMAATQCFLPSHYHPERQQKRSVGVFNDKTNKILFWGGQYLSVPLIQSTAFYRNIALNVWFAFICVYCMAFTNTLFGKEGPLEVHKYLHGFLLDVGTF